MSLFTTYIEYLERIFGQTNLLYRAQLRVYQRARHLGLSLINGVRSIGKKESPVQLYYFHGKYNFGDQLNLDVMRHYDLKYAVSDIDNANLICIGSVLDNVLLTDSKTLKHKKPIHILGAGFIIEQEDKSERFNRPVKIHGLRGKLSFSRCQRMANDDLSNVVLGDPGLLVKRIFPDLVPKNPCDVGVICHYHDKESSYLKNIQLEGLTIKMLDVYGNTEDFLKEMKGCDFIFSSSLHGLICADALGIPNKAIILSGNVEGSGYKFRDYYSVFENMEYSPVDLRKDQIFNDDLQMFRTEYKDLTSEVEIICSRLDTVFKKVKDEILL